MKGLNVTEEELQIETGSVEIIDNVIKGYYDADDSYQRSSSNADRVEYMENIVYPDYDFKYPEYFSGVYIN